MLDNAVDKAFKLSTSNADFKVFGTCSVCRNEGQVDVCFKRSGQVDLCLFRGFLKTLHCLSVGGQVDTRLALEVVYHVVHQDLVDVVAAQTVVTVGCKHFKHAVADFQNGHVECTAAQVVNHYFLP